MSSVRLSVCLSVTLVDSDITSRLAKAGCAFGKLQRILWGKHDVSRETKVAVYQAVVLTIHMLYMVVKPLYIDNLSAGSISSICVACAR